MQYFRLLGQKLSELWSILYWAPAPPLPPPVTKLPVELCASHHLTIVSVTAILQDCDMSHVTNDLYFLHDMVQIYVEAYSTS